MASTSQRSVTTAPNISTDAATCVASRVPFLDLCTVLERIQMSRQRPDKWRILGDFVASWRKFHSALHGAAASDTTDSFYAAMRLIVPALERQRTAYGVKESVLAKLYIDVLGLPRDGAEAQLLLNYRAPTAAAAAAGDFAAAAYSVLKRRCSSRGGDLTIKDVNDFLDSVAAGNKAAAVRRSLLGVVARTSALEQKWLVRMILKDMKLGLSRDGALRVFHRDAAELYAVSSDLEKVCQQLRDPAASPGAAVQLFSAFKPMLAAAARVQDVESKMSAGSFYIETKLDGERMQLHKDGDVYKYFSRNTFDFTRQFGGSPTDGSLTPFIHGAFGQSVVSCILDGEMMAYDEADDIFRQKGSRLDVKALAGDAALRPCFCVFDVLMLNGTRLTGNTLRHRCDVLGGVFSPLRGRLEVVARKEATSNADVAAALNDAIDSREEGVVVKDPASPYRPDRRGDGWLKIKPEYVDGLMDELDLLVVGGYWGTGRRGGMMSHFLCAAAAEEAEPGEDEPSVFVTLCRVGSGYTMTELRDLGHRLAPHWRPYRRLAPPPPFLRCGTETPNVFVEPRNSVLVQVKAAEIVSSEVYAAGCTLRFPRIEAIRSDKSWRQCDSLRRVEQLRHRAAGKLASRHVDLQQAPQKKKRKKAEMRSGAAVLLDRFKAPDLSAVAVETNFLCRLELCVVNGNQTHSKTQLETAVVRCGGSVVQNPGPNTHCVIASTENTRVKNLVTSDLHDVVWAAWLLECLEAGARLPWQPRHMVHAAPPTRRHLALSYDAFGDAYFSDTDPSQLRDVFARVTIAAATVDVATVEEHYGWSDLPTNFLRPVNAFVHGDGGELMQLELRLHGATVEAELQEGVSHVVVVAPATGLQHLRLQRRCFDRKFKMVAEDWVTDCISNQQLIDDKPYLL